MKSCTKKIFNIHSNIGKVSTSFVVILLVAAIILGIFGMIKIRDKNEVVRTNFFLQEKVPIHNNNYTLIVNKVGNYESITIKDKKGKERIVNGKFIGVNITITQNEDSSLRNHKIDRDDFKIKDHTGVYVPLNDIAGAVGWDAIDIHIDDSDGGHVMSSVDFQTTKAYKDYNYIDFLLMPGVTATFNLFFQTSKYINVNTELIVLEVDFYFSSSGYKKGTDIILLNRPDNLN